VRRELFMGVPVPCKEFEVAFGDYVEVYEGMDNMDIIETGNKNKSKKS